MNEETATNAAGDGSRPPSSAGRARWATVMLWVVGFACVANLGVVVLALFTEPEMLVGPSDDEIPSLLWMAHTFGYLLFLLANLLAAVTFLAWIYRARVRQRWFLVHGQGSSLFSSGKDITPGRSVYAWFIPIANFVLPYEEVRDLFQIEGSGPGDQPPHLPLWWGTFLGGNLAANASWMLERRGGTEYAEGTLWLLALHLGFYSVAAFLCARWIAEFERRTTRRVVPVEAR
jgi:hypothetical protein